MASQGVCLETWLAPSSKLNCGKLEKHFVASKLIIFLINVNIFKGNSLIRLRQPMQALRKESIKT